MFSQPELQTMYDKTVIGIKTQVEDLRQAEIQALKNLVEDLFAQIKEINAIHHDKANATQYTMSRLELRIQDLEKAGNAFLNFERDSYLNLKRVLSKS